MDDGGFEATAEQHLLGSFEGEWEEDEEVSIDQIMEAIRSGELNVDDLLEEEQHPLIGLNRCILGSILSLGPFFVRSLAASLLQFAVLSAVANDRLANLLTSLAGLVLLWANSENRPFLVLPLLLFFALSSSLINYPKATRLDRGFLCVLLSIAFIVACEFSLEAMDFMTIRGQLMIAAMKQISLCFDLEVTEERESKEVKTANGTNDHQEDDQAPFHSPAKATAADLIAQLAFVFQPSTLLFGPFICWPQFEQIRRDAKQHWRRPKDLLVHWLLLIRHLAQAFLFLLLSTCLLDPHSQLLFPAHKLPWLIRHFLTALAFRCSHYFVCHFSAATALLGGQQSPLEVVRWQSIEWPRSMAQVAAHWNVPMHTFLRKYVFNRANHRMGLFPAVLLTFAVSAALHGLDIQMAAVLLSLGLWAFVERRFRSRLASALSACVGTRDCLGECQHRLKKLNPMVVGLRLLFVAFNIFQLIYLGAPFYGDGQFQGYSLGHLWQVWAHEFWLSGHLTCLAIFIGTSQISKQKRE